MKLQVEINKELWDKLGKDTNKTPTQLFNEAITILKIISEPDFLTGKAELGIIYEGDAVYRTINFETKDHDDRILKQTYQQNRFSH